MVRHSIILYAPGQVKNNSVYCQVANQSHLKALLTSSLVPAVIPSQCFFMKTLWCGSLEAFEVRGICWSLPPEAAVPIQKKLGLQLLVFSSSVFLGKDQKE